MTDPLGTPLAPDPAEMAALAAGEHTDPHRVLGAHPAVVDGAAGAIVRAWHPDAAAAELVVEGRPPETMRLLNGGGLFASFLPGDLPPAPYRVRFRFPDGNFWERGDPYRFLPTVGEVDLHLFNEGNHRRLYDVLGAHPRRMDGVEGTAFAVWAPGARRVSVVGDFCGWDGRLFPMRSMGASGIWELFVPGVGPGALYKFEVKTREGMLRMKADPYALAMELPPGTGSRVDASSFLWGDTDWMAERRSRDSTREAVAIYEVHLGSWARVPEDGERWLTYREIAPRLVDHVKRLGFTHVQLLPVSEHPFTGSWGYQVSAYFAPTARYGTPDDFRFFVDHYHRNGVGVILDWVPAHFPKDDFALRRFDGTALYEHDDPRQGEHPDWGTLIFNYGRKEVANFLLANALYWLREFHVDGLRVDAVASMLYLDYSRQKGEWIPNRYGGRENLEAVDFLRHLNGILHHEEPGCVTIAEESTAWPGVTRPPGEGGLGFDLKWNMGWMHDTLAYLAKDPVHRRWHHDQLTFAMLYEYSERFVNPLSHDEVVHGKGSLLNKMPGDAWQKFANLRLLYAYQYLRPGKPLVFMGGEFAQEREWSPDRSLDWHLLADPMREGLIRFLEELGRLYHERPPLWRSDPDPWGFAWIDCADRDSSIVSFLRRDGEDGVVVVLNLTPVPREGYRIGTPRPGRWLCRLSSDDGAFGGSGYPVPPEVGVEPTPWQGWPHSMLVTLPPLSALVLVPE
jgi:1,4-alpha-glucan branching enzyme